MQKRWWVLVFGCLMALPVMARAEEPMSLDGMLAVPVAGATRVDMPDFLTAAAGEKLICTASQTMCPGGGTAYCTGSSTCKVFCGEVKCDGVFHKCTNPCCSRTYTCPDGSTFVCKNWKSTDCSQSASGVECDGFCFDPCSIDPCAAGCPPLGCPGGSQ